MSTTNLLNTSIFFVVFTISIVCLVGNNLVSSYEYNYSKYTPEELSSIDEMRSIMSNELYMDVMKSNVVLVHILRARDHSVPKAVELLRNILAWRKANKIDSVLLEDFSKFQKLYPYFLDFGAYHGGPVYIVPLWDIRKIMLGGHRTRIVRYIDRMFEEGVIQGLILGNITQQEITQGVLVVDMNGFSASSACLLCLQFYYDFVYHLENYYPQVLSDIFLINTPRIFTNLLQLIKPLLSESTEKSLQIYGVNKRDWQTAIFKVVPLERLRVHLGGKLIGPPASIANLSTEEYNRYLKKFTTNRFVNSKV